MVRKIEFRMYHFSTILFRFKIKIECIRIGVAYFKRQGCFSNLTRPKQRHSRKLGKGSMKFMVKSSENHPGNYGYSLHDLHGYFHSPCGKRCREFSNNSIECYEGFYARVLFDYFHYP